MKFLALLVVLAVVVLYGIIQLEIPPIWKFGLGILEMGIVGHIMVTRFKMEGEMGLILLKSTKGLEVIDRIASTKTLWQFLADSGNCLGYGLAGVLLMRKQSLKWKLSAAVLGIFSLLFISNIVAPMVMPFLSGVLGLEIAEKSKQAAQAAEGAIPLFSLIVISAMILGGLFLVLLGSVIAYGAHILLALAETMLSGTQAIHQASPGATLLLPGVNLPFFEGIAALVIIMIMHEGAHAILARICKVPVISSGIVLFGIIPVGAFIEPDEKILRKTSAVPQTRVLMAGSTSNLLGSALFFAIFLVYAITVNSLGLRTMEYVSIPVNFIYAVLGLVFSLSFIVGTVNLLPLPFFDGYRVLEVNIPNKLLVKGVMYLTLIAFLMNLVPWLFKA